MRPGGRWWQTVGKETGLEKEQGKRGKKDQEQERKKEKEGREQEKERETKHGGSLIEKAWRDSPWSEVSQGSPKNQ